MNDIEPIEESIDINGLAKKLTDEVEQNLQDFDWFLNAQQLSTRNVSDCLNSLGKAVQNINMALRLMLEQVIAREIETEVR